MDWRHGGLAMAANKSRPKKGKSKRTSLLSRLVWGIWFLATGGGVAGWAAPDLPVLGPLVQRIANKLPADQREKLAAVTRAREQRTELANRATAAPTENSASIPAAGNAATGSTTPASLTAARKPADTILIASFNIQVFGSTKLSKSWIVNVLAQVVRQFDVVAIQEVRSQEDRILPDFVAAINADGSRYNFVIGPRLGRTVSTEQYAFVYDTNRIEVDSSSIGTIQDPRDEMHREPHVARFRARTSTPNDSFTFWLVNAHTDPDEVAAEVSVLADVFLVMQQARADEDDVILLGDLNASDRQFGRLGQIPGIAWAVHDTTTNTRRSKMYDNLLFDRNRTAEFTGRWGVFDLESAFQLTRDQALEVSDHLPVWAEFQAREASGPPLLGHSSRKLLIDNRLQRRS